MVVWSSRYILLQIMPQIHLDRVIRICQAVNFGMVFCLFCDLCGGPGTQFHIRYSMQIWFYMIKGSLEV